MMKCPRCGFTQPRDQYCAQCGVDVLNYKPPQLPLFDRITQNLFAQLGFVALIIFFVASFLIKKKDHALNERVNYLKGNLQINSQKAAPAEPLPSSSNPGTAQIAAQNNPNPEASQQNPVSPSATAAMATTATAGAAPPSNPSSALPTGAKSTDRSLEGVSENKTSHVIKISYYEVTNRIREMLMDESRNTGQFNNYGADYAAGLLNQFQRRLPTLGKDALLLHSEVKNIENENPITWFNGLESSTTGNHIGFRYNLKMTEMNPNSFEINFEIAKSWKENIEPNTTSIVTSSYPLQIEMLKTSACFISGILSPASNVEGEDYISSVPPFTILKSKNFRQRLSQFLIVIEIER